MLAESIMYNEQDLNYDFRIPKRLYNFQHNNKQVFVENYSVNPVQLSARKRIGTISCVEPVIDVHILEEYMECKCGAQC